MTGSVLMEKGEKMPRYEESYEPYYCPNCGAEMEVNS